MQYITCMQFNYEFIHEQLLLSKWKTNGNIPCCWEHKKPLYLLLLLLRSQLALKYLLVSSYQELLQTDSSYTNILIICAQVSACVRAAAKYSITQIRIYLEHHLSFYSVTYGNNYQFILLQSDHTLLSSSKCSEILPVKTASGPFSTRQRSDG